MPDFKHPNRYCSREEYCSAPPLCVQCTSQFYCSTFLPRNIEEIERMTKPRISQHSSRLCGSAPPICANGHFEVCRKCDFHLFQAPNSEPNIWCAGATPIFKKMTLREFEPKSRLPANSWSHSETFFSENRFFHGWLRS